MKHYLILLNWVFLSAIICTCLWQHPFIQGGAFIAGLILGAISTVGCITIQFAKDPSNEKEWRWRHSYFTKDYLTEFCVQLLKSMHGTKDQVVDITAVHNDILNIPDAIFQFNTSAFTRWKSRRLLKPFVRDDYPIVFGTDCHNSTSRKPNFDLMLRHLKKYEPNAQVRRLFE